MLEYYTVKTTGYPTNMILTLPRPENSQNCSQRDGEISTFEGKVHVASLAVCTVLVIFVLLMGCIGNAIVLVSAFKWKKLRTNFDVLVLNLTGSDFMTCSCLAPIFLVLLFIDPPTPKLFCGGILFLGTISAMLSLLTLVAIALHRLARVIGQARGTTSLTRIGIILVLIWTFSLVLAFGGTFHVTNSWDDSFDNCQPIINSPDPAMQNFVLFFLAPVTIVSFIIITLSYIIIAWIVQKQSKSSLDNDMRYPSPRASIERQCKDLTRYNGQKCSSARPCASCTNHNLLYKDNKILTMCLVVILTMGLCWGPLIMSQFIELATGESIILYQVKLCGIGLVFLNSALDPYIYAQHIGKMKQKFSKLFKLITRCRSGSTHTTLRIQGIPPANLETCKFRSRSHANDVESNTVQLKAPGNIKKIIDKCVGSSKQNNFYLYRQNLLVQSTSGKFKPNLCTGEAKKNDNESDFSVVAESMNGFVNGSCSCSQGTPRESQSLIDDYNRH